MSEYQKKIKPGNRIRNGKNKLSRLERSSDIKGKTRYHPWPMSQKPRRQDFIDISTYYLKSNFRKSSILFDDSGAPLKRPLKRKRK